MEIILIFHFNPFFPLLPVYDADPYSQTGLGLLYV